MQPQGQIFNQAYFDAIISRIEQATSCEDLQRASAEAYASVQAQSDAIASQLAALAPLQALLKPPTNLGSLITWVTSFITAFLTPYLKPLVVYAAQMAQLAAAVEALGSAIQSAAGNMTSCSVTPPSVTLPSIPEPPEEP